MLKERDIIMYKNMCEIMSYIDYDELGYELSNDDNENLRKKIIEIGRVNDDRLIEYDSYRDSIRVVFMKWDIIFEIEKKFGKDVELFENIILGSVLGRDYNNYMKDKIEIKVLKYKWENIEKKFDKIENGIYSKGVYKYESSFSVKSMMKLLKDMKVKVEEDVLEDWKEMIEEYGNSYRFEMDVFGDVEDDIIDVIIRGIMGDDDMDYINELFSNISMIKEGIDNCGEEKLDKLNKKYDIDLREINRVYKLFDLDRVVNLDLFGENDKFISEIINLRNKFEIDDNFIEILNNILDLEYGELYKYEKDLRKYEYRG